MPPLDSHATETDPAAPPRRGTALARLVLPVLAGREEADVALARASLRLDAGALGRALDRVAPAELEGLLTRAARHLGVLWAEDRASFAEVTLGTARLQAAYRARVPRPAGGGAAVLLALAPGEQHGFGMQVLATRLGEAGYSVTVAAHGAAVAVARRVRPSVLGVGIGSDGMIGGAARLVAAVRSVRPGLRVLAGGPVFAARGAGEWPAILARVGADAAAACAESALDALRAMRRTDA